MAFSLMGVLNNHQGGNETQIYTGSSRDTSKMTVIGSFGIYLKHISCRGKFTQEERPDRLPSHPRSWCIHRHPETELFCLSGASPWMRVWDPLLGVLFPSAICTQVLPLSFSVNRDLISSSWLNPDLAVGRIMTVL